MFFRIVTNLYDLKNLAKFAIPTQGASAIDMPGLPKITLPHFSIVGEFSLMPPQVPHIGVEWYRKAMDSGMILTSPTILPAANGSLRGFGDAGPEAVVGVDSLRSMISDAVTSANAAGKPRQLTVIFEANRTQLGRCVYDLYNEENQRVGMRYTE